VIKVIYKGGKFINVQTKLNILTTMEQTKIKLSEPNQIYKRFLDWTKKHDIKVDTQNLCIAAITWIETDTTTIPSSKRTYFSQVISGYSIHMNIVIHPTPLQRKIQKQILEEMEGVLPNRAPFLSLTQIQDLSERESIRTKLLLLTLCCARIGNADGFLTRRVSETTSTMHWRPKEEFFMWTMTWVKHKTYRFIGPQTRDIPIPASMMTPMMKSTLQKTPFSWEEVEMMVDLLEHTGTRLHSIRRSGAKYWQQQGMPLTDLQRITLHTSLPALESYLQE
jgi:hypothetical protein